MKKLLTGVAVATLLAAASAQAQVGGNLAATPAENLVLDLTGAAPALSANTLELVTGDYYRLTINSAGGAEVTFQAPEFFQNIWMNQIVAGGVEVKLWGAAGAVAGVEVGDGGAMSVAITFVPIRPGEYTFTIDEEAGITGTFIVR